MEIKMSESRAPSAQHGSPTCQRGQFKQYRIVPTISLCRKNDPWPPYGPHRVNYPSHHLTTSDAAHVVHPLAGQGLNLGISDARALAAKICKVASIGGDIGDTSMFDNYQLKRLGAAYTMAGFTDAINQIFGYQHSAIDNLRAIGMKIYDHLPILKFIAIRTTRGSVS